MGGCERRIWGSDDGLRCCEDGAHRTHRFQASDAPDRHDDSEVGDDE